MILQPPITLISSLVVLLALSGCGNKGDLYLPDDPVIQQDMEQLQRVLDIDEVPVAEPVEVDDEQIEDKPAKKDTAKP
ncbi:LPS translocon maturation chaperone LptM [Granulosicoccus sp. 3-233]|uniref:LPS translocon maturation chaperone LptM n=1 Tax=Granulosicoccus sp. 3-233 TaxID=3417969 RepID=UPI003D33A5B5